MTIDRELLWRAWPDGFVAIRGIRTMAGYQCVGVNKDRSLWLLGNAVEFPLAYRENLRTVDWLPDGGPPYEHRSEWREQMGVLRTEAEIGGLLPDVDPTDAATWACLLFDLGCALFAASGVDADMAPGGLVWLPHRGGRWMLEDSNGGIGHVMLDTRIEDPALALVMARIKLRENTLCVGKRVCFSDEVGELQSGIIRVIAPFADTDLVSIEVENDPSYYHCRLRSSVFPSKAQHEVGR